MKKFLSFVIIAAAMIFATGANAQVKFGLKGGLDVINMSLNSDVLKSSNKAGFFIGPMVKVTVPVVGLSFDAAALYDQKEAKVSVNDVETTMRQKSINIPVNIRYGWGLSSLANVFVFAGPQWGINVGDKDFKWNDNSSYSLKKSNFSVNVGLGVTLMSHLQVSANYNIACGKTADVTWKSATGDVLAANSKNNSWQIALGYWF